MEGYTYNTVGSISEGIFTNKGSKFIGYLIPVKDEDACKAFIKNIRAKHTGARHFCYAWRLGDQTITERANDDGEPSGTAGKPILNQLKSADLTMVLAIVVRYFGGTLLGSSGLIQAYKLAIAEAIKQGNIIQCEITRNFSLNVNHENYNSFMELINKYGIKFSIGNSTQHQVAIEIQVPLGIYTAFNKALNQKINQELPNL